MAKIAVFYQNNWKNEEKYTKSAILKEILVLIS